MSRKRKRKKYTKCPEPFNSMLDIAQAITLGYAAKKIFTDEPKKKSSSKIYAPTMALHSKTSGVSVESCVASTDEIDFVSQARAKERKKEVKRIKLEPYVWRKYCEDGTAYGISPEDYTSADSYNDALEAAKSSSRLIDNTATQSQQLRDMCSEVKPSGLQEIFDKQLPEKYIWRKYCEDGTPYGMTPEDFETADDYVDALSAAKNKAGNA